MNRGTGSNGERGARRKRGGGRKLLEPVLAVIAFAVLAVALELHVRFGPAALQGISTDSMDVHADFYVFWLSAQAVWSGGDIYNTGVGLLNLNPPIFTVLISPLGLLEPLVAYRFFVLLTLLITVEYLAWTAEELRLRVGLGIIAAVLLLLSAPLLTTFVLGQVYPLLALGLVAAWVAERHEKPLACGGALGLVVALKPLLAPVILWPLVRRRWSAFGATIASGAAATLIGVLVLGPGTTFGYVQILQDAQLNAFWGNASLPSAAARLFTENESAEPLAVLPWMVPAAYAVGIGVILLSALRARHDPEGGLWALVAASLLASPIGWYNYLVLLAPGVLLLLVRDRVALGFLLLALQFIPPQWPDLWSGEDSTVAALALTLYTYILIAHWLAFVTLGKRPEHYTASQADRAEPGQRRQSLPWR